MIRLRLPVILALLAALAAFMGGCATFSAKTEAMRGSWATGDFAAAEAHVDHFLAQEAGVDLQLVTSSKGTDPKIKPEKGDVALLLLEKGMTRLARGDAETAVKLMRKARDQLDKNFVYDSGKFFQDFASMLADDTIRDYPGADYDHIMVRSILALADLISGGGDAFAYAVQVGEKQEEIIGSPLGEVKGRDGYKPRERYRRVGFGAYIQGLIREDKLIFDEAARAYDRALTFEGGDNPVFEEALKRVKEPSRAGGPTGVLHVFELAGEGPFLVETRQNPTAEAVRLAGILLIQSKHGLSAITQAAIPLPQVFVANPNPAPLKVSVGRQDAYTQTVLDVNRIASEQNEANMPWAAARAVARRTVKAVASTAAGQAVAGGGKGQKAVGAAVSVAMSIISTATENADTRSWSTLPAEIRTARIELPPGDHKVMLDGKTSALVRIAPGRASYILVVRPTAQRPPAVLVDRYSLAVF